MAEDLKRVPNFTTNEVNLLLEVVKKFSGVIECKKTDSVSWKQKEKVWVEIAREFNARSGAIPRGPKNLRCKYDNLKKTAKKNFAAEKVERYKTGGGPFTPTAVTSTDIQIKELIDTVSVDGLSNSFDSDGPEYSDTVLADHIYFENPRTSFEYEISPASSPVIVNHEEIIEIVPDIKTGNATKMNVAVTPRSTPKTVRVDSSKNSKLSRINLTADCRQKVNALSDVKIELGKLQMEVARKQMEEHEQIMQHREEEHQLKKRKLELEITLLENQLV